jgi:hypothetical protein
VREVAETIIYESGRNPLASWDFVPRWISGMGFVNI